MPREQTLISRFGNKTTDIKYFEHYLPKIICRYDIAKNVVEPFGGSFAVLKHINRHYDKGFRDNIFTTDTCIRSINFVNDNCPILYSIYTNPLNYKQLLINANNICLANLNENGNVIYNNVIGLIDNLPYDRELIEHWKLARIMHGRNIKPLKHGINVDESIKEMQNIKFSCVDWYNYTLEHAKNPDTFIFLDPPYLFSDNSSYSQCRRKEDCDVTDIIYKIYEIFINPNTKAKIMLIINDMKILRWLFEGYVKGEYKKTYQIGKRVDNHIIICNYDDIINCKLSDYI